MPVNNNLPYINIYKGDFLRSNVSACSIAAQGLWLRLMILMHDSERTGYLCLNGEAMPSRMAAVKCSLSPDEYALLLAELMAVSAFNTSREGIIFSPEIVAQNEDRARNAERQRRFKEKSKGNGEVTPQVTPRLQRKSSSSSTTLSSNEEKSGGKPPPAAVARSGVQDETDENYFERKQREFPKLDVTAVYIDFVSKCGSERYPKLKKTRRHFDKWLEGEDPPLDVTVSEKIVVPGIGELK
jgi:hypothetical protein